MYILVILFISFPLFHCKCNNASEWFNENHPWDFQSDGNDIERFSIIRAKYPFKFEYSLWTGLFEIRKASYQSVTNQTMLIEDYTQIYDGFICHAINGKQCIDYEIRFCIEYNPCSISAYPPYENQMLSGTEARPYSLPWYVSIQYEEKHICAGTLIDNQHILTAASCFQDNLIHIPYSVVLDAHYRLNSTYRISVERFIFHSDYNLGTSINNIAVIRLSQRIQSFTDRIRPACLAQSMQQPHISNPLIVAGWCTIPNNTWSISCTNELRQAMLTLVDECSYFYGKYDFNKQICAGTKDSKRDLCQGDIGGGLFEKQKYDVDRWILTGIVSYGCDFAPQGYPGVYVRISAYYDWIQHTIQRMNKDKMK
ncbi:unnamed protein product [Rotaria sordida]|uniref:Peptidase S1 domain-containing protein n=1 Tax=Rotaria sordida TaxID=392033 RepID=A0A819D2S8_9BILA|nr:unnamed protein product [Rotaria sordida]CAF1346919.1 unnamed protein product [Rotaria sordida]CAF1599766.1 unnamed protein product [Rotaria sordida]CAF3830111.1 unnamed protein product [Rotaria sordida]